MVWVSNGNHFIKLQIRCCFYQRTFFDIMYMYLLNTTIINFFISNAILITIAIDFFFLTDEPSKETSLECRTGSTSSSSASEDKPDMDEGEDDQAKFARLVSEARDLTSKGQVKEALEMYKEAQKISPSDKLSRKMERMEVTQDFNKNCLVVSEVKF